MAKVKHAAAPAPAHNQKDGSKEMVSLLKKIEGHLAALVYYQQPSRGFDAPVDAAIGKAFTRLEENKDNALEGMIREEIKNILGE